MHPQRFLQIGLGTSIPILGGQSTAAFTCATLRHAARPKAYHLGDPNGILTRVTAVKGRCPRPLDDRVGERQISRRRHCLQACNMGEGLSVRTVARVALPRSDLAVRGNLFNQCRCPGSRSPMRLKNAKCIGNELFSRGRVAQQPARCVD